MNTPLIEKTIQPKWTKHLRWLLPVAIVGALLFLVIKPTAPIPVAVPVSAIVEVPRIELELRSARLYRIGATNPFHGWLVEFHRSGSRLSRSAVTNGQLHGLSQGWHTNGQLQVNEQFVEGVSQGRRTKWSAGGAKLSEASIVDGQLHGTYRRWHENGTLAEQIEFRAGQPEGVSLAYFESGFLKARAASRDGQVIKQEQWKDGQMNARFATAEAFLGL